MDTRIDPERSSADSLRVLRLPTAGANDVDSAPPEWLVANGLGGYACGTITGVLTRRYHGLLVAALPVPHGRTVMLSFVVEHAVLPDGRAFRLGADQFVADDDRTEPALLTEFRLEQGLPVWVYDLGDVHLERRLAMLHGRNTTVLAWRLQDGAGAVQLLLRPWLNIRPHDARVGEEPGRSYRLTDLGRHHYEIAGDGALPPLRLLVHGEAARLSLDGGRRRELTYATEARRGYDSRGTLWSPGCLGVPLRGGTDVALVASTEPWESVTQSMPADALRGERTRRRRLVAQADPRVRDGLAAELVVAADAFVVVPPRTRPAEVGADPHRTVIAGYHWFTDWGRDTMIGLEGLTLVTGRPDEARGILRTFAQHVRDGLIPNLFPEHGGDGFYNTADATLWFFHALDRYVESTGDRQLVHELLPKLIDIVERHVRGTRFGIGVDPEDGLLRQGADGLQLTWMDAKVDDWVVTPRRGKAVEINALWYNALRLLEQWLHEAPPAGSLPPVAELARRARAAFDARFWYEDGGYLYDVVDGAYGDDASCRPNQVFALSLRYPVLEPERWRPMMDVVEARLLTPVGLRSLAGDHPDYRPEYSGDLRARDAAYHQGTVWGWLIGPFVDAWLKVHPERRSDARRFLDGFAPHLDAACVGSISEIFDAEPPFAPRGCIAQAWSVAEVLRAWRTTTV